MSNRKKRDKAQQKEIAKKRITKLFSLAEKNSLAGKLDLSDRYVEIARKISMRYLVPIPKEYKRRFCKNCYSYLLPHVNSRYRIQNKKLIIYCKNCSKFTRIPLKNK
jgi:ribonuclease P protein subunit RPR2